MPPYLPVVSIERAKSVQVRLGSGPGNSVPPSFELGDTITAPQSGKLHSCFYANLADGKTRRDLQHHSAIGQILHVGVPTTSVWSDLFVVPTSGLVVTGVSSSFNVKTSAGIIQSR